MDHRIGTREEWLAARKALLVREKELTRQRDALAAKRRALPWVRIDKSDLVDSSKDQVFLGDLFENRTQLMTYHFMFGPDWKAGCPGCSFLCDHVDAARQHFEHNNLSFAAVSRASVQQIEASKKRMGWTFAWVSSQHNDFHYDVHGSVPEVDLEAGPVGHNIVSRNGSM